MENRLASVVVLTPAESVRIVVLHPTVPTWEIQGLSSTSAEVCTVLGTQLTSIDFPHPVAKVLGDTLEPCALDVVLIVVLFVRVVSLSFTF